MKKLTIGLLEQRSACFDGRLRFKRIFPRGTFCTKGDVAKIYPHMGHSDVNWLANTMLSGLSRSKFWMQANDKSSIGFKLALFAKLWRKQP
jgi:hypothetical protein